MNARAIALIIVSLAALALGFLLLGLALG